MEENLRLTLSGHEFERQNIPGEGEFLDQSAVVRVQITNELDTRWRHPVKPVLHKGTSQSEGVKFIDVPEQPKHLLDFKIVVNDTVIADFDDTR